MCVPCDFLSFFFLLCDVVEEDVRREEGGEPLLTIEPFLNLIFMLQIITTTLSERYVFLNNKIWMRESEREDRERKWKDTIATIQKKEIK